MFEPVIIIISFNMSKLSQPALEMVWTCWTKWW